MKTGSKNGTGLPCDVYDQLLKMLKRGRFPDDPIKCRCDERLKGKAEGSTPLAYTGWYGELEHLKIKTRLINERFASVMGECVIWTPQVCHRYSK